MLETGNCQYVLVAFKVCCICRQDIVPNAFRHWLLAPVVSGRGLTWIPVSGATTSVRSTFFPFAAMCFTCNITMSACICTMRKLNADKKKMNNSAIIILIKYTRSNENEAQTTRLGASWLSRMMRLSAKDHRFIFSQPQPVRPTVPLVSKVNWTMRATDKKNKLTRIVTSNRPEMLRVGGQAALSKTDLNNESI
jgi:hypothetical protein